MPDGQEVTAILYSHEVHAEMHGGVVKVVHSWTGDVLLSLTIGAAEVLTISLDTAAQQGRLEAKRAAGNGRSDR